MIEWTPIQGSRAIRAVGLERGEEGGGGVPVRIHVKFRRNKGKSTYVYEVGNIAYFDRFVSAASKGRFYVFVIKARFDYVAKY
ncbi:MAG TPA: hypothetical protein VKX17_02700 [Planctomycetota bacterium]|nr:hypothetical protein [Planctomycetota bacterium]